MHILSSYVQIHKDHHYLHDCIDHASKYVFSSYTCITHFLAITYFSYLSSESCIRLSEMFHGRKLQDLTHVSGNGNGTFIHMND